MSDDPGRTFLSRWSRRKIAARTGRDDAPANAPAPPGQEQGAHAAVTEPPAEPAAEKPALPDVESLQGLESDYREFLRPEVDESIRRTALKKLFADPHFNVMDGLDTYIDDYSKPDPIPQAMLRALNQARGLFLFDEEEKPQSAGAGPADTDAAVQKDTAVEPPLIGENSSGASVSDLTNSTRCPEESGMSDATDNSPSQDRKIG